MAKAKKQKPQRLPGAEETCISPEQEAIVQWFQTVKFRKNLLGGVDEVAMWKKLEELYALYDAAIRAERTRYNTLLENAGVAVKPPLPPTLGEVAVRSTDGEGEAVKPATAVTERFDDPSREEVAADAAAEQ